MADKDDRPGGMLEIPDSLGRDLDRAAARGTAPPPIEAFLSDDALRQIETDTRAKDTPVRAENLIPISPAEAARRRTQTGDELPRMPAMRRVIPAPFKRPRIEAGSHGKRWQYIRADQVTEGDIIPNVGRVASVEEQVIYASREHVEAGTAWSHFTLVPGADNVAIGTVILVRGIDGVVKGYKPGAEVQAFRSAVSGG